VLAGGEVDVAAFLRDAVAFCNGRAMGSLSAGLIVHPRVAQAQRAAVEGAIEDLRYGTIAVNAPSGLGFVFTAIPWGAWAAAGTRESIGTGNALTHNTSLYDHAEKGVLYYPWRQPYTPVHFASNTNLERTTDKLIDFVSSKNLLSLCMIIPEAIASK